VNHRKGYQFAEVVHV